MRAARYYAACTNAKTRCSASPYRARAARALALTSLLSALVARSHPLLEPATPDALLQSSDDLLAPFHSACKPRERFRVGTEAEKQGLLADGFAPLPFEGPRSVRRVLELLADRYGWQPEREHEGGVAIALLRDNASITLEPAGQLELSGAPFADVHQTKAELDTHLRELREVSAELGIIWLSLGFHPFATHVELPHVPKFRYAIMQRYLPTRGPRSLDMMRRTCTVQANLDYSSEADAIRKLRIGLALQPVVTALFANSPFVEGRVGPRLCERAAVWLGMDPDRSGLLPFAWERNASFQSYVEWALDVPMFLIKRGDRVIDCSAITFRTFMRDGIEGERATQHDWETHLNTMFPEARLKRTLELRGADAQSAELTCALPALWRGLLYDPTSLDRAEALIGPLDPRSLQAARPAIAERALGAELAGRSVQRWAQDVLELAIGGLQRLSVRDAEGRDESVHLEVLRQQLERGETSASRLVAEVQGAADFRKRVVQLARL
jgi:glutamate--cysteine ligase